MNVCYFTIQNRPHSTHRPQISRHKTRTRLYPSHSGAILPLSIKSLANMVHKVYLDAIPGWQRPSARDAVKFWGLVWSPFFVRFRLLFSPSRLSLGNRSKTSVGETRTSNPHDLATKLAHATEALQNRETILAYRAFPATCIISLLNGWSDGLVRADGLFQLVLQLHFCGWIHCDDLNGSCCCLQPNIRTPWIDTTWDFGCSSRGRLPNWLVRKEERNSFQLRTVPVDVKCFGICLEFPEFDRVQVWSVIGLDGEKSVFSIMANFCLMLWRCSIFWIWELGIVIFISFGN